MDYYSIITGNVLRLNNIPTQIWMHSLKTVLMQFGHQGAEWEIYNSDYFHLKIPPQQSLEAMMLIKAYIRQHKGLDIKLAAGIGCIDYHGSKITESNGSAFEYAQACVDQMKKDRMLIKTAWKDFDNTINIMLRLLAVYTDSWTVNTAPILVKALSAPWANQQQLARLLNLKAQSSVSEALKRAGYDEIKLVLDYFKKEIHHHLNTVEQYA